MKYRRALKGGSVEPNIAMKIMFYTYCATFNVNPVDAYNTPISIIRELLEIHGEVKTIESEHIDKMSKGV